MIIPEKCRSMAEVRAGIDALDEQIVTLLALRMRFMEAAARIKPHRHEVRDEVRKAAVLDHVADVALGAGFPAPLIRDLYERLIEASIAYEYECFDQR